VGIWKRESGWPSVFFHSFSLSLSFWGSGLSAVDSAFSWPRFVLHRHRAVIAPASGTASGFGRRDFCTMRDFYKLISFEFSTNLD
jgi:hypothetical protein